MKSRTTDKEEEENNEGSSSAAADVDQSSKISADMISDLKRRFPGQIAGVGIGDTSQYPGTISTPAVAGTNSIALNAVNTDFTGWVNAFFVCNVLAVGIANAMAAQAATSRLLFSMSRDGQLPRFLRHINSRKVPSNAILFVGALSAGLVLFFVGQIGLISSMVNFGALTAFLLLHASVIWFYLKRTGSRNWLVHLACPLVGLSIIGYVLVNAGFEAQLAGLVWLIIGIGIWGYNRVSGRAITITGDMSGLADERI